MTLMCLEGGRNKLYFSSMAFNEQLAERVRTGLTRRSVPFEEKVMFGGLCFMVDEKMCVGVVKDELMTRVSPEEGGSWMERTGTRPMDFAGKRMKGFYFISLEGVDLEEDLDFWIDACLNYNPMAKKSAKKKK